MNADNNQMYKTLLENLPQKIFYKDADSIYILCNQQYANDLNIQADEIQGKNDFDFYPKELAEKYRRDDRQVMESGKIHEFDENIVTPTGQTSIIHTVKSPIKDSSGDVVGILGIFWDITASKQAEKALRDQAAQFLEMFNHFPEILYVTDPHTNEILFVNNAWKDMLGKDPTGGICYKEFQGLNSKCDFCTDDIILKSRKPYSWEHFNPAVQRHFWITDQILKWPDGRDVRFEVAVDITARKKAEEELQKHKERLEELVHQQMDEILELSTPVMRIWDGIVVAPLIGTLDSQRTKYFMDRLLNSIDTTNAQVALIDITGVPMVDTQTAQNLIDTIAAARLLGARVVLTGVQPAIAQALIHLGIDLSTINTYSSLAMGLKMAIEFLNGNDQYKEES